jgi:hypothetical protein
MVMAVPISRAIAPEKRQEEGKFFIAVGFIIVIVGPVTPSATVPPMTVAIWPQIDRRYQAIVIVRLSRWARTDRCSIRGRDSNQAEYRRRCDERTNTRHFHEESPFIRVGPPSTAFPTVEDDNVAMAGSATRDFDHRQLRFERLRLRGSRRVLPRRHRAEPQDASPAPHLPATKPACVASRRFVASASKSRPYGPETGTKKPKSGKVFSNMACETLLGRSCCCHLG